VADVNKHTDDYSRQTIDETIRELQTDGARGLESAEVDKRIGRFGFNEIAEKEEPLWHRVFRRFWGPIPWMIEAAALLSAVVRKWDDFVIIAIMLLVNAGLDFFQEHRALNALQALKQRLTAEVIVLRDGKFMTIPARELVPGDVIKLRIGNIVPADVQLLQGDYLLIDQSSLTGESLPVTKKEYGFSEDMIRSLLFLKLIVAGHSTLYITRARGWFWQRPWPSPLLFGATFGTEILGTLIAVYGFLITPTGWKYALWMWVYALAWFVFNDAVKIGAYRLMRQREVGA
jgi:H+-transporting ATPase